MLKVQIASFVNKRSTAQALGVLITMQVFFNQDYTQHSLSNILAMSIDSSLKLAMLWLEVYLVAVETIEIRCSKICRIPIAFVVGDQWPHQTPGNDRSEQDRNVDNVRTDETRSYVGQAEVEVHPEHSQAKNINNRIHFVTLIHWY